MSRALGQFILRFKFLIVAVWVLAAIWMVTQAPLLKNVAVSETSEFLPATSPSMQAQAALSKAFPDQSGAGSATLVVSRAGSLTDADNAYAKALADWLASPAAPKEMHNVTSLFNNPGTESLFLSPDRSTMLINVGLTSGPEEQATIDAIGSVRQHIKDSAPPQGLGVNVTGTSSISSDQRLALFAGVDRTALVTVLLVIIILLLIYRSPVAAMTPLVTIGMAYVVSRGVLGYLATAGWKISSFVDTFIIVIIFGVGTDYCLFILSRFREELARRANRDESIIVTMSAIGAVIAASASTVIVALVFMATGQFVMLQTMGPAMALCVFITLIAGLTLTPALVAILGHYLFWPRHDEIQHESGRTWQRIAEIATTRYGLVAVIVVAVLLIPYLALPQLSQMFDVLAELPKVTDSVQGFNALSRGFDPGELLPVTVLVSAPQGNVMDNLDGVDQFVSTLEGTTEVQRVRSVLQPTGDDATASMFHVDTQLKQAADGLNSLIKGLDDPKGLMSQTSGSQSGGMGDLKAFLTDLGRVQAVASLPAYNEAISRTQAVDSGLTRLSDSARVTSQLDTMSKQMAGLATTLKAAMLAPTAVSGSSSAATVANQFQDMATYMAQLGQAYPALAKDASYANSLKSISTLVDDMTASQQALLVTNQLGLLAQQLQSLSAALSTPAGALALTGSAGQQLPLLAAYYGDLGKAYPAAAGTTPYQSSMAHLQKLDAAGKQMLATSPADLAAALTALKQEVDGLIADTGALRQWFTTQNPAAQFVPQNAQLLSAGQTGAAPDPSASAQRLADNIAALANVARTQIPNATFTPTGIPLSEAVRQSLAQIKQDATSLQATLNALSATTATGKPIHFLPRSLQSDSRVASLLKYFLSNDSTSTRLTVVLKARPYSSQANRDVQSLLPKVQAAAQASGFQAIMGGAPVVLNDVQQTISRDFIRIAILTLIGVFIVLILLLRSLVAPIYLVLTVLLSYGTTLGISTLVFQDLLGQEGVNYIIPIVVFVLLVALGADYNIFLMSRVREESEGRGTRQGIRIASAYTGGIITSCGIILAGTFAAMMVAPIQTLFQVGFAVAAGVLVDTFIIRAVLVPAIAAALGERNWWPGKIKTQ
jgi:putative drug exporter of the RND superfamily